MLTRLCAALFLIAAPVWAQNEAEFDFPNPLRLQNLAATCNTMRAQINNADPQAMQALIGVWQGVVTIPGAEGLYAPSQGQIQVTYSPNGTFEVLTYGCITPLAGGQAFCNTGVTGGEWAAHFTPEGWIAAPSSSSGTGLSGGVLPLSCGINFWRMLDAQTMESDQGVRVVRVQ
jgi:hypothetical protein